MAHPAPPTMWEGNASWKSRRMNGLYGPDSKVVPGTDQVGLRPSHGNMGACHGIPVNVFWCWSATIC